MIFLLCLSILFFLLIIALFYVMYLIRSYDQYFKSQGLSSPPYSSCIFGHFLMLRNGEGLSEKLAQWTTKYGSVYGLLAGTRPMYVVSDVNFLEEVFVRQFSKFHGRHIPLLTHILGNDRLHIFASSGHQWRLHRKTILPAFSSIKLKGMSRKINDCINTFLDQSKSDETDILIRLKQFTLDVICRCAFDVETRVQETCSNVWLEKVMEIFVRDFDRSSLAQLNRFFPMFGQFWAMMFHLLRMIGLCSTPANLWIIENAKDLINERFVQMKENENNHKTSYKDLLQLLFDATKSEKTSFGLAELLSHVFVIMVSGFDSPSTILSHCLHTLAAKPDLQEKLFDEMTVNGLFDGDNLDQLAENDLSKLVHLDAFIREVLRMNPTAVQFVNRRCVEETQIQGYRIPKGSLIQADVYSVHFSEELWGPLPVDEFHLERHFTKRHPLSLLSFGVGPRQCPGLRFAFVEMKLFLTRVIHRFYIEKAEDHQRAVTTREELTISPDQVWVKLTKRQI